MKNQFTILFGPVESDDLGKVLSRMQKHAPLIEVKSLEQETQGRPVLGKIVRHRVTEDDVKKMNDMAANGVSLKQIANNIGCAEITVKRHVRNSE